jgi:hypothetical protein
MGRAIENITTLSRLFSNFGRVGSEAHKRTGCATGASHYPLACSYGRPESTHTYGMVRPLPSSTGVRWGAIRSEEYQPNSSPPKHCSRCDTRYRLLLPGANLGPLRGTARGLTLFCAEPYSSPGYFHPGDIGTQVAFPDVALHFVVRRARHAAVVLRCMNDIALQMAGELGAVVLTTDGFPFNLKDAERELDAVLPKIASVQHTRGA